jgi:hypothetical protein
LEPSSVKVRKDPYPLRFLLLRCRSPETKGIEAMRNMAGFFIVVFVLGGFSPSLLVAYATALKKLISLGEKASS